MKTSKKLLSLALSLVMAFSLAAPAMAAEDDATPEVTPYTVPADAAGSIVILHTNDVHGAVETYGKVAALKKAYEAAGAYVLLMDAGDYSQGTTYVSISEGATAIQLMNAAGYDVATTGNHEFDYGYANLKTLAEAADFPILAANILYDGENAFESTTTFTATDGTKIGVFGLETPETATKAHPAKIQGVTFLGSEELYACAQTQVDALKAEDCDIIICLGHLGVDDESAAEGNRSLDLLANVTGIDVFIDGHSHSTLAEVQANADYANAGDTAITSTGTKLANVGVVTIKDGSITVENVPTETLTDSDADVDALAASIMKEVDDAYGVVFASSDVNLNGDRAPGNRTEETNLGDLITDAMLWYATKDGGLAVDNDHVVALTNGGGIRAAIAAGDVTKKDINTVLPFGNTVAVVYVSGAALLETLEASTYSTPTAVGGFPQVAGIDMTINTGVAFDQGDLYPGSTYHAPASINRVTVNSINGQAFDADATYAVITNDFLASGGDTYYAFTVAENVMDTGTPLDEAVMAYITDVLGGTVGEAYAAPAGRITIVNRPADLDENEWWYATAIQALDAGLMQGTDKGFEALTELTRASVLQTLYNMNGTKVEGTLTDVEGQWYADAANWAASIGLVEGDTFGTDGVITRGDTKDLLDAYSAWAGVDASGLMVGNENGDLMLDKSLTRAEYATILVRLNSLEPYYTVEVVAIEVPETDGIPAHTIPATLTLPVGEGTYPAVVMLHGTGSTRDEAGNGYATAAPIMAKAGIATIRIDFMGNGDSTASYTDYCYTSANIDAKAAADYVAALDAVDGDKIAVMGWSQGGTNALLAAVAYPETFKAVVTWSGALDLTTMFDDVNAAYETAKTEGSYEMTFDWRDSLPVGERWFQEVLDTDMVTTITGLETPVLAINGDLDDTVPMENAEKIVEVVSNGTLYIVEGADHTYNVFSGDDAALLETIDAGIDFLQKTLNG